jgi:large subunit ribosomal protein L32
VANLKWKTPRSKTRSRRAANWQLGAVTTVECPQCHQPKRPHFVCEACGMYDGRQVVEIRDEHAGHDHE